MILKDLMPGKWLAFSRQSLVSLLYKKKYINKHDGLSSFKEKIIVTLYLFFIPTIIFLSDYLLFL